MANVVLNSNSFLPSQDLQGVDNALAFLGQGSSRDAMTEAIRQAISVPSEQENLGAIQELMSQLPDVTAQQVTTQKPVVEQPVASQQTAQSNPITEQPQQINLLDLLGQAVQGAGDIAGQGAGLLGDLAAQGVSSIGEPISSTGQTSNLFDMLRGVAAVNAPQQSAIFEKEITDKQAVEKQRKVLEAATTKATNVLQEKNKKAVIAETKLERDEEKFFTKRQDDIIKQTKLNDDFKKSNELLRSTEKLKNVITSGTQIETGVAIRNLLSIAGEKGKFTDRDIINIMPPSLVRRIEDNWNKLVLGRLSPETRSDMEEMANILEKSAIGRKNILFNNTLKSIEFRDFSTEQKEKLRGSLEAELGLSTTQQVETRIVDGREYKKVEGGWELING